MSLSQDLPSIPLPPGVSSHYLKSPANDLTYHFLSAGNQGDPLILLYHGFPETSFCWRHILPYLAQAGYYAVAPDTRGSGRTTTPNPVDFTESADELRQYQLTNTARDTVIFIQALGYSTVHCLVGHDAGAVLVAWVALTRPDLIQRVIIASHPYNGPPAIQPVAIDKTETDPAPAAQEDIHAALLKLPHPRKHYKWYYAGPAAAADLQGASVDELRACLKGYYYLKSASWPDNKPHPLCAWTAAELAQMPYYYVMPADSGMAAAVQRQLQRSGHEPDCSPWLTDAELEFLAHEWNRTGFQGALNWYRIATNPAWQRDLQLYAGKKLACPSLSILGRQDWGSYQEPGVLEAVGSKCLDYRGEVWIEEAGHWMQQEQPEGVARHILKFCQQD
ncbi:alpha/beta fold hydrolase [Aspergillus clavatus NRRL 1]|uniref:Epoxide hydrolase, putative n=1 Tax=Aspergillus clavatus (strain ATCC 1007 / CBS 513.65 / DSM 816 / NCTC 3887 / NRRL 1 / QM 1276 / 107) TaxID=344612 RepID=A1C881_ASPCL|nr:epoxide hydrolase, putative [Aspergillus clavatus NRRL 1]EAW14602.1 epoxide hydrolase, putative [Aspergillus clavatus NRRL 1]